MKNIIIQVLMLLICISTSAQQNLQTVTCVGGKVVNTGQFLHASVVGEMTISRFVTSTYSGTIGYLNDDDQLVTTGLVEEVFHEMSVHPNPTFGSVTITLSSSLSSIRQVDLFDAVGGLVYSQTASGQSLNLDLNMISPGAYFLHVHTGVSEIVRHVIKL